MEVDEQMLKPQSFHKVLLTMSEGFLHVPSSIFNKVNAERADMLANYSSNNSTVFSFETMKVKIYLWNSPVNKYCNFMENILLSSLIFLINTRFKLFILYTCDDIKMSLIML